MTRFARVRIVLPAAALAAAALAAAVYASSSDRSLHRPRPASASFVAMRAGAGAIDDRKVASIGHALQQASASGWNGESYTTNDGKQIGIYFSSYYLNDPSIRASWVPFLSWLPHGDEMNGLQVYLAPLSQVTAICGAGAVGCYSDYDNYLVVAGDRSTGVPIEQVLAHEYGHRIAAHRLNSPWSSEEYGPKYWATYANVCQRTAQGSAFPGDEGVNYANNPGEAFADTYRAYVVSLATGTDWATNVPFLTPSFPNDDAAQYWVATDVHSGWPGPENTSWAGTVKRPIVAKRVHETVRVHGKRTLKWKTVRVPSGVPKPAVLTVETPLDGDLEATIENAPNGATLSVLDSSGTTAIGPVGVQHAAFTICGQRSVTLSLRSSNPGSFSVSLSKP